MFCDNETMDELLDAENFYEALDKLKSNMELEERIWFEEKGNYYGYVLQ